MVDKRLAQLLLDLETKESLCCVRDYPGITLEELNQHLETRRPLVNPVFGEQHAFFIDQGHFTPYRMVAYGNAKVAPKINQLLSEWAEWSSNGGSATPFRGAFVLERSTGKPTVRMPHTPLEMVIEHCRLNKRGRTVVIRSLRQSSWKSTNLRAVARSAVHSTERCETSTSTMAFNWDGCSTHAQTIASCTSTSWTPMEKWFVTRMPRGEISMAARCFLGSSYARRCCRWR